MSIYELKPRFQNLLRPLVRRLYSTGVTANEVTIAACVISVLLGGVLVKFADISVLFFLLPAWSVWVLYVAVFLLAVTCVNRVRMGLGE